MIFNWHEALLNLFFNQIVTLRIALLLTCSFNKMLYIADIANALIIDFSTLENKKNCCCQLILIQ